MSRKQPSRRPTPATFTIAALAFLTGLLPHAVAQAGTPVKKAWEWRGDPAREWRIAIDLIRADVSIAVAAGPPTIRIIPETPAAGTVSFTASTHGDLVEILDRYPIRAMRLRDCLPPADAGRGDYWSHPVKLRVVASIPPGTALGVRVRSGNITADAAATHLDLHTGDGAVIRRAQPAPTDSTQGGTAEGDSAGCASGWCITHGACGGIRCAVSALQPREAEAMTT